MQGDTIWSGILGSILEIELELLQNTNPEALLEAMPEAINVSVKPCIKMGTE